MLRRSVCLTLLVAITACGADSTPSLFEPAGAGTAGASAGGGDATAGAGAMSTSGGAAAGASNVQGGSAGAGEMSGGAGVSMAGALQGGASSGGTASAGGAQAGAVSGGQLGGGGMRDRPPPDREYEACVPKPPVEGALQCKKWTGGAAAITPPISPSECPGRTPEGWMRFEWFGSFSCREFCACWLAQCACHQAGTGDDRATAPIFSSAEECVAACQTFDDIGYKAYRILNNDFHCDEGVPAELCE